MSSRTWKVEKQERWKFNCHVCQKHASFHFISFFPDVLAEEVIISNTINFIFPYTSRKQFLLILICVLSMAIAIVKCSDSVKRFRPQFMVFIDIIHEWNKSVCHRWLSDLFYIWFLYELSIIFKSNDSFSFLSLEVKIWCGSSITIKHQSI